MPGVKTMIMPMINNPQQSGTGAGSDMMRSKEQA